MVKIICDVCKEEISSGKYQEIKAYSMSVRSVEERLEKGSSQYFLTLKQVHFECAEEVERVVKETVDKYLLLARAEAGYATLSCQEKS